jgi:large subunit ribosomal protein L15
MLHLLKSSTGSRKKKMRVGRGNGSKGTFSGKGCKGQKARSGGVKGHGFEGGQTPLIRRQPKRGGFRNPTHEDFEVLNIDTLEQRLEAGTYTVDDLKEKRLVDGSLPVKVLGRGTVAKKFDLTVHAASKGAKSAIEKAGGSVTVSSS